MVDLCHGPHLPSTGYLKAAGVTNMSRAFWRADVNKEALMRVYAITFPGGGCGRHMSWQAGSGCPGAADAASRANWLLAISTRHMLQAFP
jgi:hypothetical protein